MRGALQGGLQLLASLLVDGQQRQALAEEQLVASLLAGLQGLARLPGAATVREAALLALLAAMELPYHLLHQHRPQVGMALPAECLRYHAASGRCCVCCFYVLIVLLVPVRPTCY